MYTYFKDTLKRYERNFTILKGTNSERLATAIEYIDQLLNKT